MYQELESGRRERERVRMKRKEWEIEKGTEGGGERQKRE